MNKFNRWKEGMKNLTPEQFIVGNLWGYYGNLFGFSFAWVFLVIQGMWYFSFVMIFALFFQVLGLMETHQKLRNIRNMQTQMEDDRR